MNKEPEISLNRAKEIVATKTAPRVTEESIKAKIARVQYFKHEHMTHCIITMQSGFFVSGVSAPASVDNYDMAVGERYAYDNAFKQLWQLEGYLLRDKLSTPKLNDLPKEERNPIADERARRQALDDDMRKKYPDDPDRDGSNFPE